LKPNRNVDQVLHLTVMKAFIYIGITVGGVVGGLIGAKIDGGLGLWSILLGGLIGPFIGLWAGYKLSNLQKS
jgi:predicted MFS family arabinose efflux permease